MSAIATVNIDLAKIPKSRVKSTEKGGKYLELTISINDDVRVWENKNKDGETYESLQNVSVSVAQTKDERENKTEKTYIGNGRVVWVNETGVRTAREIRDEQTNDLSPSKPNNEVVDDDFPF